MIERRSGNSALAERQQSQSSLAISRTSATTLSGVPWLNPGCRRASNSPTSGPSSFRVEPNSQNQWSSSSPVGMWAGCF